MLTKWIQLKTLRLDRYIFAEVIQPFLGGVAFFTFLFLMFQALRLAEFFIVHGISGLIILKLVFFLAISFLPMALPIAFLIAVLVAFGRLSADSELVAMKSSGISLTRMAAPVLVLAFGVVIFSLFLNLEWVPWSQRQYRRTIIKVGNTKVVSSIQAGTFTSGFFDLLVFADEVNQKTNQLKRVFIFDEREPKNPLIVVAQKGRILPVRTRGELGSAVMFKLLNGNIHQNQPEEETYQKIDFGEYRLFLEISEGVDNVTDFKPHRLSYGMLMERMEKSKPGTEGSRIYKTEYWRRISIALSAILFVFLGIGYGTIRTRSVRSGAALITFFVILVYWSIQAGATTLAHKGQLPPVFAMQLPNLSVLIAAFLAFRKSAW